MNRFFRLIILLAIPVAFSLAVYLQDKPVQAAGDDKQKSDQMALEAEGRDVLVIDGDTIMIDGVVADIAGIDAPELGQQCLHNGSFWDCGHVIGHAASQIFRHGPLHGALLAR